jgi:RNA polymerase sigma factor (sigma-70 family)
LSKNNATGQECDTSGEVQAASVIFFEHGDFIRTVIRHKIKDESLVEDLLHDFFLSLISNPMPPDVRDIKSYIFMAITNDITDHVRRIGRYQTLTKKTAENSKIIVNYRLPEDALIEKEHIDKMIGLVKKRVSKKEYKAITSRYYDNLSVKETAGKLNIDRRSVVRYISTGFRKVKRFLAIQQEVKDDSAEL